MSQHLNIIPTVILESNQVCEYSQDLIEIFAFLCNHLYPTSTSVVSIVEEHPLLSIPLETKDAFELCFLELRVFREQIAVGADAIGLRLTRIYPPLGRWRDLKSCSIRSCKNILIKD
jgi:hypothetical protein